MTMTSHPINQACPDCKKTTVSLSKSEITCQNESCGFKITYNCPICKSSLESSEFQESDRGEFIHCQSCQNQIYAKRIAYLINNHLFVDFDQRCKVCSGPTIHRPELNLTHRCYFFPKCSGQTSLFGEAKESLVFLDFETTGLEIGRDTLIEIGALKIDEEGDEESYQVLINPGFEINPRIIQITGITNEMLVDGIDLETAMKGLIDFIGDSKIVAHNAEFDILWLIIMAQKLNLSLLENTIICTLKWAKASNEGRCSLGALTKKYKIGHANAHRALADAAATKELFFIYENLKASSRPEEPFTDYLSKAQQLVVPA